MSGEIRLYYFTTQSAAAASLKDYVNRYLDNTITDDELKGTIKEIVRVNQDLFKKNENNEFALKIRQGLGKKRLKIITQILEEEQL